MRIARATITPFRLPLRAPLQTAHENFTERRGWLLELEDEAGGVGQGEASPLAGFGMETSEVCVRQLVEHARTLVGYEVDGPDALLDACALRSPGAPGALAAVDSALHDLCARVAGVSIAAELAAAGGRQPVASLAVNCLVGSERPGDVAAAGAAGVDAGFACFKLKLGRQRIDADLERASALRGAIGDGPAIRVDANGAWSESAALGALEALARLGVEYVEQPVPAEELAALARLRAASPVPIAADEAASSEAGARAVLDTEAADLLILKPGACGGLRAASRIAEAAAERSVGVVVTTLLESAIGTAAAWQLAAALPADRPADGLATSGLFVDDLARLPEPTKGRVVLPGGAGLGVAADAAALVRLACGEPIELSP